VYGKTEIKRILNGERIKPGYMRSRGLVVFLCLLLLSCEKPPSGGTGEAYLHQLDELDALWSFYKYTYIADGRVVSLDEDHITTSEGQGYAMLRAVWANDPVTFDRVWQWTKDHLRVRNDRLFAWKWKGRVLDKNSAADADVDIALALLLAGKRFSIPSYQDEAMAILADIWAYDILRIGNRYYLTAGSWALREPFPTLHVAYFAPYAYEVFARVDQQHPWKQLIRSSYDILRWIYVEQRLTLPPEIVFIDKETGKLHLKHPRTGRSGRFSYDAFPIFWRVAVDADWFGRDQDDLRKAMLAFFQSEWTRRGKFLDTYTLQGVPQSAYEGLPLYATVHALAHVEDPALAARLRADKLDPLWRKALAGQDTPYYLHNWLWFDRAFELQAVRHYEEWFGFLRPFDMKSFSDAFPWMAFSAVVVLYGCLRMRWFPAARYLKAVFLLVGFYLCFRYLAWRLLYTLNFIEPLGPLVSIPLWLAECYCVSTVVLLALQVGLDPRSRRKQAAAPGFAPSVDIYIPIYSEPLEILEKTLIAARAIRYPDKKIYVLDDSRRESVAHLALQYGAYYLEGPRKHAKAGNLNNALGKTGGELIAVFDTDHIPVSTFLEETVPCFADPAVGAVQTPHHFYNQDIFQRACRTNGKIPNDQDMFHHRIQGGRDNWNGAFFVGSAALFRRSALESIGGFQLMSITEDIHTSQHLNARGWKTVFVNKDLAVGLAPETLGAYLIQRRRWMLGCLQIFFKDNPLFQKGLALRHRLGYFASLYYFFFPVIRVVFWITPLYYLLFHLHPIFSEVSLLLAYLVPCLLVLPLLSRALLLDWPRLFWGTTYENAVCVPLFRSMFDLFLPKRLGFKVTPKGLVSEKRTFDFRSTRLTLIVAAITVVAIVKGVTEFYYFGIEKDAYFFNLIWATYNLMFLGLALLVAWERPQRRAEERVKRAFPVTVRGDDLTLHCETHDLSLSGLSIQSSVFYRFPPAVDITLAGPEPLTVTARLVYHERVDRYTYRCGFRFDAPDAETQRWLIVHLFAAPATWQEVHQERTRSSVMMGWYFFAGILNTVLPLRQRRRTQWRERSLGRVALCVDGQWSSVLLRDVTRAGFGVLWYGREGPPIRAASVIEVYRGGTLVSARPVYVRKMVPFVWRIGFTFLPGRSVKPERRDAVMVKG
jgi:cellulose synthase (UDP-forming)